MEFDISIKLNVDRVDTIIFDMDDTLVYTSYANLISYKIAIYEILGVYIKEDRTKRFTKESIKELFPSITNYLFNQIVELKNELFSNYLQYTRLNYILFDFLKNNHKKKKLILATNSNKARAIELLKYHNLEKQFNHIFYKKLSKTNKYKNIIEEVDINIERTLVFENEIKQIVLAKEIGFLDENIIKI